ncbi:MAG: F0F1 ATP synthase subunit A [Clostridiales bacterium]|nr:F0F1 ATP synthase subunit A [Clostridiales bacterium]
MQLDAPEIAPKVLYSIGSFDITVTMFSTIVVTVALILFAVVVRVFFIPRWNNDLKHTSAFRMFIEWSVGMFDGNSKDMTENYSGAVGAMYFGCSAFIMFGILIELFGLRSPLSDLNCNIILGLITFFAVLIIGFMKKRTRRLTHYATIIPLVTDIVVPFSMALRLFGSVFSGYLIMDIVYQTALRNILPVVLEPLFTLFHAAMQAYIFMFLSMNFINEAIE